MSEFLLALDDVLYYPILIIVLLAAGLYFTFTTGFVQFRWLRQSIRVIMEKPEKEGSISSFQALMVSTASRVGTGNIIGISTALCLGGFGSVFWMWAIAMIGSATAFIESTLPRFTNARMQMATATAARPTTLKQPSTTRRWPLPLPSPLL